MIAAQTYEKHPARQKTMTPGAGHRMTAARMAKIVATAQRRGDFPLANMDALPSFRTYGKKVMIRTCDQRLNVVMKMRAAGTKSSGISDKKTIFETITQTRPTTPSAPIVG